MDKPINIKTKATIKTTLHRVEYHLAPDGTWYMMPPPGSNLFPTPVTDGGRIILLEESIGKEPTE